MLLLMEHSFSKCVGNAGWALVVLLLEDSWELNEECDNPFDFQRTKDRSIELFGYSQLFHFTWTAWFVFFMLFVRLINDRMRESVLEARTASTEH